MTTRGLGRDRAAVAAFVAGLGMIPTIGSRPAVAQDLPPLEAPLTAPAPAQTPAPATTGHDASPPPAAPAHAVTPTPASRPSPATATAGADASRPFLVIPGVTVPVPTPRDAAPPTLPATPTAPPELSPPQTAAADSPAPLRIPLSLEPIDDEEAKILERRDRITKDRAPGPRANEPERAPQPAEPARAPAATPRNSSFLSRFFAPPGAGEKSRTPDASIVVEHHSDPAAESALKRRIEKELQQDLGDRVRSVEVRVSGRTVNLRAQASHFWLRRSVRRSLESHPLPAGYRARVEVVD